MRSWISYAFDDDYDFLVGGFNPFEKNSSQIGSFPQIGGK